MASRGDAEARRRRLAADGRRWTQISRDEKAILRAFGGWRIRTHHQGAKVTKKERFDRR
jgi:hypothetical protein